MRLVNSEKIRFGFLACLSMVALSCGQPMKQTTVHLNDGKLTTSDDGIKPAPAAPAVPKPVRSTFENDCNAKRGIKTVQNEDGSKTLLLHSFCIKNASAEFDETAQTMRFRGTADFEGYRNLKSYDFDVTGPVSKGRGILRFGDDKAPDQKDPEFVAAAFCNQISESDDKNACGSFFIDLYVKVPGFDTELFDEQVADCGTSDQCLSVDARAAKPVDAKVAPKKESKPADVKDAKPDAKSAPEAAPEAEKKTTPTEVEVPTPPEKITQPDPLIKVDTPALIPDAKIVKEEPPVPSDLEINPDDAEQEGADLPDTPAPYVALNTANKINSLIELFNPKSRSKNDILSDTPIQAKPADPVVMPPAKEEKAPPKTSAPAKNPPAKKPEVKQPDVKLPEPKPLATPEKNSTPVKAPSEPEVKPEIKTRQPDPIDPRILKNEFPFNIAVPTRGPMQVYGGGTRGWLVNPTELTEPVDGEPQTYVIDTNTKNLRNRSYRKTFGAFYTVDFLKKLAGFTYEVLNHPIRINDISLQRGGHLPPHSWHRVGLDADVEYSLVPQDIAHQMTPEQKWMIFQRVGASPLVNGIFVDIKDKRAACEIANLRKDYDPTSKLAMSKLKVEAGHKTHFHINFSCTYNEHCNQKEDELRNQYEKNLVDCMGFKMSPAAAAKLASKK